MSFEVKFHNKSDQNCDNTGPFAYALNQDTLAWIMQNPTADFRIAQTVDIHQDMNFGEPQLQEIGKQKNVFEV